MLTDMRPHEEHRMSGRIPDARNDVGQLWIFARIVSRVAGGKIRNDNANRLSQYVLLFQLRIAPR